MEKKKKVYDKKTGEIVLVDSIKDFLEKQESEEAPKESVVEKEEEVVEEINEETD